MFVQNCIENYTPSEFFPIDQMLVAFRSKCPFRQYIPSKPAKYGIKIHVLCNAKAFYVWNMEIYAGHSQIVHTKVTSSTIHHRLWSKGSLLMSLDLLEISHLIIGIPAIYLWIH